jgi:hypothetical protein
MRKQERDDEGVGGKRRGMNKNKKGKQEGQMASWNRF